MIESDGLSLDDISRAAHDWRALLSSPDARDEDRRAFEAWLAADVRHEEAYDRAVTLWAAYDHLHKGDIDEDLMRPTAMERWSLLIERTRSILAARRLRFAAAAAAAVIIAVIAAPAILPVVSESGRPAAVSEQVIATYSTKTGETATVTLDDGTIATLGASTEIETALSGDALRVSLKSGAALFELSYDAVRPFSVEAGDLTAKALGTSFDVRNNGGVVRIAVADGEVEVAYPFFFFGWRTPLMTREKLAAGQQIAATVDDGLRGIQPIPADQVAAWRDDWLVYDDAPLKELIADADRYDSRRIMLEDGSRTLGKMTITGSFSGAHIDALLSMLSQAFPVTIDRSAADTVLIRPNGAIDD